MPAVSLGAVWLSNLTVCIISLLVAWDKSLHLWASSPPSLWASGLLVPGLPFFFISRTTRWRPAPFHGTNDLVGMSKKPTEVSL